MVSKFHDHLATAPIGFDEDSGAFQVSDPVLTQSFDGADTAGDGGPDDDHINNANMDTPPDGTSPTLQLYLFDYSSGELYFDYSGDDAGTVWHEYTHGLSNRLVVDEDGVGALNSAHAGAMGEAWSDWYAEDLLVREGLETDDPDLSGDIDIGEPSDAIRHGTRFSAIDCPVGQGSSDLATACPGGLSTGPGGFTLGDFGNVASGPEVHSDGEIWVQTLWDLRQQLVEALGSDTAGSDAAEAVITMGMRLAPPEPSMLDMRNAILQADTALNGGDLHDLIWSAFAHRGMGYYATAFDGNDVKPAEDFNLPPAGDAPQGNLRGTITDSQTGLPLAGVAVRIGAATNDGGAAQLVDTTGADGRYEIDGITEGTYAKLAVRPAEGGYDPVDVAKVVIRGGETITRNVTLNRNWASKGGGASIAATNDDTGEPSCGPNALIDDQDGGLGWEAWNPNSPDYPAGLSWRRADRDDQAAAPRRRQRDRHRPGDHVLRRRVGDAQGLQARGVVERDDVPDAVSEGEFTPEQAGDLNLLEPAGAAGDNVSHVRLTMLSPQNECDTCSGRDFIDVTALEVFGAVPNTLPSGSLTATPAAAAPGQAVAFDASSFRDPDSAITGYDWDFDGNGSVDRTTAGPTTSFAYAAAGTFAPRVAREGLPRRGGHRLDDGDGDGGRRPAAVARTRRARCR